MKHKVVFPIIFAILLSLACQFSGQTPAAENLIPTQTQETTIEPTVTLIPTETPKPQENFSTGSEIVSEIDSMTLVYVPAGEFTMGVNADEAVEECEKNIDNGGECRHDIYEDEEPPHSVDLEAFWIDKTEVTNKMYSLCVSAGVCSQPEKTNSSTYPSYYGNPEFDNYPVVNVNWNMAKADWTRDLRPLLPQLVTWKDAMTRVAPQLSELVS